MRDFLLSNKLGQAVHKALKLDPKDHQIVAVNIGAEVGEIATITLTMHITKEQMKDIVGEL
jgi:hypothetical protein